MTPFEVFTPTGIPTVTYVDRGGEHKLESQLTNALKTPGLTISLSGPSKSGKTTLVKRVVSEDLLISVSGGAIKSAEMLWDRVLNWMEAPSETSHSSSSKKSIELGAEAGGKAGFLGTGVEAKGSMAIKGENEQGNERKYTRTGLDQVIKEIANSEFVVFIDDFHYMASEIQTDVARQCKEAAEKGIKICTASVPHRADDVVRSNNELRGRVQAVDFDYWTPKEIAIIAHSGFDALNISITQNTFDRLASEAFGSPQLMQQICLQFCFYYRISASAAHALVIAPTIAELNAIFEQASTTTDFSSLLTALHAGPKPRGMERNKYAFADNSRGDVYRCVLLALQQDPPKLGLSYDDIYQRSKSICIGEGPTGSSLANALEQLDSIAKDIQPGQPVLEWSEDVLDIVDPYFLYYMRCSPRLSRLGVA